MSDHIPVFGESHPEVTYAKRPGVYAFFKKERFYRVALDRMHIEAPSSRHRPEWLMPDEAVGNLTEECQKWAVSQVIAAIEEEGA